MTDARKALAEALMRAIDGLTNYADDLDATERPAIGEYDVTADIRLVCQALIDRHAADIAAAALDNLPRVTVREGFERRTGQATPRTLPGTREEVARASAGTQDREAMLIKALRDILLDGPIWRAQRIARETLEALSALQPAPMPERMREMRAALERAQDVLRRYMRHENDATVRSSANAVLHEIKNALAPHDKIADSSGPNPGAIGASKEAGATTDIATVAPASTVSHDKTEG